MSAKTMDAQDMTNALVEHGFRRAIITMTVVICCLLELIDTTIVNVATNTLMGNLGATVGEVSWVIASYAIANVIVVPLSSWLSSFFGRKYYYGGSVILFTLGSLLCGTSTGIWELVFFRFIQGLGGGALFATSQSILVEIYPKEKLGMANAMFGMGVIIGPTIGPLLGGYLVDNFHWSVMFFVNVPIGILAAFLSFRYIKNNPFQKKSDRGIDWLGILLLIAGIGSMQFVLEQGDREDWFESPKIILFTIIAIIGVALFIWRMLVRRSPVVDLKVLKKGNVAIGTFLSFIMGYGLFGSVFIIPLFTQRFLGFPATMTGQPFTPGALLTGFLMPVIGISLQKGVSAKKLIAGGFFVFGIFLIWCSLFITPVTNAESFFWPLMFRGLGMAMLFVPMANMSLSGLQGAEIAQAAALTNMVRQLGGSFGVAIISFFVEHNQAQHSADLASHISNTSILASARIQTLTQAFSSTTADMGHATQMAYAALMNTINKQAAILSYIDTFQYLGVFILLCVPLAFLARTRKGEKVDTSGAH